MTQITIQKATKIKSLPTKKQFQQWIDQALPKSKQNSEVVIRIVDIPEITKLNKKYRKKNKPTNIISFNFEPPPGIKSKLLGDLVICAPIVRKEAKSQKKTFVAHWAHLTTHGVLHLLGHDHHNEQAAKKMETLEIKHMKTLGYTDPYSF